MWRLSVVVSFLAFGARSASADYESEQNDAKLGVIERAFDAYTKDPAIFDGETIKPGVTAATAITHANLCARGPNAYLSGMKAVTPKGRGTERGRKLTERHNAIVPWCQKLAAAANVLGAAAADARTADKASEKQAAERQTVCQKLIGEASTAVGGRFNLGQVMDTWKGNRTLNNAESVKTFRTQLEALGPVCKPYGDVETCRKGNYATFTGESNAEYSRADICVAASDPAKTLTEVVMRALQPTVDRRTPMPTIESFRKDEGWIQTEGEVKYATYFQVSAATKAERTAKATEMLAAGGVAVPADLSMLWSTDQARLDALKAAVDATAAEWKLEGDKCKGYACALATNAFKKGPVKANVKKLTGSDWKIVKKGQLPDYRYMKMFVLYQVPGEPYCQLTSATANETYSGGGTFQKASKLQWGYVRFQTCK
ncbi:MAG: hypothetical protein H0T46_12240 [Deltaproteobacteria bacterium]|nr:hypothetical protein [Deltaproteobacteria bacterium]